MNDAWCMFMFSNDVFAALLACLLWFPRFSSCTFDSAPPPSHSFRLHCTFYRRGYSNSVTVFEEETVTNTEESKPLQTWKQRDSKCVRAGAHTASVRHVRYWTAVSCRQWRVAHLCAWFCFPGAQLDLFTIYILSTLMHAHTHLPLSLSVLWSIAATTGGHRSP